MSVTMDARDGIVLQVVEGEEITIDLGVPHARELFDQPRTLLIGKIEDHYAEMHSVEKPPGETEEARDGAE